MKILVIGGTGTVGGALVRTLLDRGTKVRVFARHPEQAGSLPPGSDIVAGDLAAPESLMPALRGVDGVFLLAALSRQETADGLAAVEATKDAGVPQLVYMSVVMPPGSEIIPHFASKIPVEKAVQASGLAWTILRPNHFYQNDLRVRDAITKYGVYPDPIGARGINRVDVRDIAEAAANAFEKGGLRDIFPINGPRGMTGDDTARLYSEQLGHPVRYAGDDLEQWANQVKAFLPAWLVTDLKIMYRFFQENGCHASGTDFAKQEKILGHAPRSFEAFVQELADSGWRK